jgi:ribosomal protein L40E
MKLHEVGTASKAICEHCKALVPTTFRYRDVLFDDGTGTAENILVAVCDQCDAVLASPAQSTPAIRRARDAAMVSQLGSRVP